MQDAYQQLTDGNRLESVTRRQKLSLVSAPTPPANNTLLF